MFRRRANKEKTTSKGNVNDPFGLGIDPSDLKLDDAALERELADMMGSDYEDELGSEEEPVVKAPPPRPKSKASTHLFFINISFNLGENFERDDTHILIMLLIC